MFSVCHPPLLPFFVKNIRISNIIDSSVPRVHDFFLFLERCYTLLSNAQNLRRVRTVAGRHRCGATAQDLLCHSFWLRSTGNR